MNFNDMNSLGQALQVSFGRSSIRDKGYGCNYKIYSGAGGEDGDHILELRFETVVNCNPREGMDPHMKQLNDESEKVLNQCLTEAKGEFKELAGKALKCKPLDDVRPQVEHISHNISLVRARYIKYKKFNITA